MKKLCLILLSACGVLFFSCSPSSSSTGSNTITINGSSADYTNTSLGYSNLIGVDSTSTTYSVTFKPSSSSYPYVSVSMGINRYPNGNEGFSSYFASLSGSKPFASMTNPNGASITYGESGSAYFQSGNATQSGASIVFSEVEALSSPTRVKFRAVFNCKAFDYSDTTNYKTISGDVTGNFYPYY